jgi:hypothetical protein
MSKSSSSWLFEDYKKIFETITGSKLTNDETEFLKKYFDPYSNFAPGKHLYYLSIFRLKRFYPRFVVHYLIKKKLYTDFAKAEQYSLKSIHKDFAKHFLNEVTKAYCKFSD